MDRAVSGHTAVASFVGSPGAERRLENAVPFDASDLKSVSVAVSVAVLLVTGSPTLSRDGKGGSRALPSHSIRGAAPGPFEILREKKSESEGHFAAPDAGSPCYLVVYCSSQRRTWSAPLRGSVGTRRDTYRRGVCF